MADVIQHCRVAVLNEIFTFDAIWHQGELWLVPNWLEHPNGTVMRPERIIRAALLQVEELDRGGLVQWYCRKSLPTEWRDSRAAAPLIDGAPAYLLFPEIEFPVPTEHH